MNFYILTLFPEMIENALSHSVLGRAQKSGIIKIECVDIRDFADNKHNSVDDYPYGGGPGMVISPVPVYSAFKHVKSKIDGDVKVVYLTPQGAPFSQKKAQELSTLDNLILLCGHYEGIDERVIEEIVDEEISIGDYVLTGGELCACVLVDSVSRLVKGVLGDETSHMDESFSNGLLEYPQYTRPAEFLGKGVPEVLLSGHHANIEKWRLEKSIERTKAKRPDLLIRGEYV